MNRNQDDETLGEIADDGEPGVLNALPLQARGYARALRSTPNVMRRFNRDTMWVAMGLLGTVMFAALLLALQERHANAADPPEEAVQAGGNALLNANVSMLSKDAVLTAKSSTVEISSGQATSVDCGFTPGINRAALQANVKSWSPAQRLDSAPRVIRPEILDVKRRSSTRLRFVDVKMRLLALWHQSLARAEKSRRWTQFWNSNRERSKNVSYTRRNDRLMRPSVCGVANFQ